MTYGAASSRPTGTPREIVERLHREIIASLALPDVNDRLAALGFVAAGNKPEEFAAQLKTERAKWSKVVRTAGISADKDSQ